MTASRALLLSLALLAGCVINTRPHLPGTADDAGSIPTTGGRDGTDTSSPDGASARTDAATDVLVVEDQGIPAACPGGPGCATPDAGATFSDAGSRDIDATMGETGDAGADATDGAPDATDGATDGATDATDDATDAPDASGDR